MRSAGGSYYRRLPAGVTGSARFSPDQERRYWLIRDWTVSGPDPLCAFVGLNPSTADEHGDDRTVEQCWKRARLWGFSRMVMLNLFAYRHTFPECLRNAEANGVDVVGENDLHLGEWAKATNASRGTHRYGDVGIVIVAWGGGLPSEYRVRARKVAAILAKYGPLYCLGTTSDGWPRHPSRVRRDVKPEPWAPPPRRPRDVTPT